MMGIMQLPESGAQHARRPRAADKPKKIDEMIWICTYKLYFFRSLEISYKETALFYWNS